MLISKMNISIYIDTMNNILKFLKAISDNNRFKIITFLKSGERCVCEIQKEFDLPQNLISHHLKVLKDNKVLFDRRDGQKIFYKLNRKVIDSQLGQIMTITKGIK